MDKNTQKAIHPKDEMMAVMRKNGLGEAAYLKSGQNNGESFFACVKKHRPSLTHGSRVLDHGCGYGRVTRHLNNIFHTENVVAADVTKEMVDFCAKEFSASPFLISDDHPISELDPKVDVVISISVFSHLPQPYFDETLKGLASVVQPEGILLVTTAGPGVAKQRGVKIGKNGFRFGRIGDKSNETNNRLSPERYSSMIIKPEYIKSRLSASGLKLLEFVEQGHIRQDLFILTPK